MKRRFEWVIAVGLGLALLPYGFSFIWPRYDWDLRLPSPDGTYDLVVLRVNASAITDFYYKIYLFPHSLTPQDRQKGSYIPFTSIWRGDKYLVYAGYDYPLLRWINTHSVEINLNEAEYTQITIEPIKRVARPMNLFWFR